MTLGIKHFSGIDAKTGKMTTRLSPCHLFCIGEVAGSINLIFARGQGTTITPQSTCTKMPYIRGRGGAVVKKKEVK